MSVNRYDPATDTLIPVSGTNNHLKDEMVAEYESTSTATHAYEVGGQFIYNGKLYEATSAISIGGTIVTEGTNANCVESGSLTEQIAKKGSADNFIGTKQQWEALTPEEQAKYKTMDFFGDSGTGTGGHTIVDEEGTTYPARAKLKFVNATVTDDSTNDTTIVEAEGGGGGTIVVTPTVTNTAITYDGTQKSPTITRDTDHTYIQGDYEATNYGTYTFTIGLSGVNDVWSDNTTEPKTYTWSINYDGGTITPVNDIQTWLKCANIDDKAYTTLSEVLADHETLYALINSNNAMDYLVRSTDWVSGITADETAMEYIGHKNYASNTLLDDSTWCTAICNSAYFESVLRTKVPIMTSNTTPSGEVSAKSYISDGLAPWKAFNRKDTSYWLSDNNDYPSWIQYKFIYPVKLYRFELQHISHSENYIYIVKNFILQGSNDGEIWDDLYTGATISSTRGVTDTYYVTPANFYSYYRLYCLSSWYGSINVGVGDLQFYGRTDVTENVIDIYSAASDTVYYMDNGSPVTVCTTDTTGHGTVSKSSLPNGTYTLYSTVAKDPDNLSNEYSKSVTIADNTVKVYVMPDGALYWYGNLCEWKTGGWDNPGTYHYYTYTTSGGATIQTNSLNIAAPSANGTFNMIGTTDSISKGTATKISTILNDGSLRKQDTNALAYTDFYFSLGYQNYSNRPWAICIYASPTKDAGTHDTKYEKDSDLPASYTVYAVYLN